jgi:endonuclease YncB( thermonuclease family)
MARKPCRSTPYDSSKKRDSVFVVIPRYKSAVLDYGAGMNVARGFGFVLGLVCLLALPSGCSKKEEAPVVPARPALTIHEAAMQGDAAPLRALLAGGASADQRDNEGRAPLHYASAEGQVENINLLLEHGATVDARSDFGSTPLHDACRNGHLAAAERLIDAGADVNAQNYDGVTPHDIATLHNHPDLAALLVARGAYAAATEEPPPEPMPEETEPVVDTSIYLTSGAFRVWTSASGVQLDAEFVESQLDTVILRKRDASLVRIQINQLLASDQVLARQLAGTVAQRTEKIKREPRSHAAGDSIGARIGQGGGWTVLEGCRLIANSANDGDSFHVRHEGKEYIFRLYYVDAAETDLSFPDRVKEQGRYFRLKDQETVALGQDAKHFTAQVLGGTDFTVVTKWEDARGNSRLSRQYAFVITPKGDLDELLMEKGLVRLYGMRVDDSLGSRKYFKLKALEQRAKTQNLGAWNKHGAATAATVR